MLKSHANPFHQPAKQWQLRIHAQRDEMPAFEEAFGDIALASVSFEVNEDTDEWALDIVIDTPPDAGDLASRMALASGLLGIATPKLDVKVLEAKDWVSEVERGFPPLQVGRFYVYGSHVTTPPPKSAIPLRISAGAAFGSGEHATTSGCLRALEGLARKRHFTRPLDMGCGSGILAIAMAKLWHIRVLGVDIDPVSVHVARENANLNRTQQLNRFAIGDGYHAPPVRAQGPFDLIVANILARPLMRMAPLLAKHLMPGGIVVLSGLLDFQERMVLDRHRAQGLKLIRRIPQNHWHTLILANQ